jgi:uncharacterized protein YcfJ
MRSKATILGVAGAFLLTGCVSTPLGPTVQAIPPRSKPPEVFAADDQACQQMAAQSVQGQVEQANSNALGTAVIGTALGAALGAAIGGGRGAAIGAGAGAVTGTAVASGPAANSQAGIQWRYNNAYAACMYARGNQVAGYVARVPAPYPPPAAYPPPPPSGY